MTQTYWMRHNDLVAVLELLAEQRWLEGGRGRREDDFVVDDLVELLVEFFLQVNALRHALLNQFGSLGHIGQTRATFNYSFQHHLLENVFYKAMSKSCDQVLIDMLINLFLNF